MPGRVIDHAANALRFSLAVTLVGVTAGGDWILSATVAWALAVGLVPPLLARSERVRVAPPYDLALVALLSGHVYGHTLAFYHVVPYYDVWLHLLAGAALGVSLAGFARWWCLRHLGASLPGYAAGALAVLGVLAWGAVWELMEFGVDALTGLENQRGNVDTMGDLLADLVGGCIGAAASARAPPFLAADASPSRGERRPRGRETA